MTIAAGTYFFPGGLDDYITKWDVSLASEVQFTLVVVSGAPGVSLRPVFDVELAVLLSGTWAQFTTGALSAESRGFFRTEWEPINEDARTLGDIYIGIVAELGEDVDEEDLVIGLAEVRIR